MKKRIGAILVILIMLFSSVPATAANTSGTIGAKLTAPENVGAYPDSNLDDATYDSFAIALTIPDSFHQAQEELYAGTHGGAVSDERYLIQIDYKLNENGSWQYDSSWDEADNDGPIVSYITDTEFENYIGYIHPSDLTAIPNAGSYSLLNENKIYFRCRFFVQYYDGTTGTTVKNVSPWSETTYITNMTDGKDKIVLETPQITGAKLLKDENGKPYFSYTVDIPDSVFALDNTAATVTVCTDYKIGTGEWKQGGYNDYLNTDVYTLNPEFTYGDNDQINIDAGTYYLRTRFGYDGDGISGNELFSDYSNIVTISTAAYTSASTWAIPEIDKASGYGLIPDCLTGADMTKPITRAEFAALSVKLYENITSKAAIAAAANPFTDTKDVETLKAYNLGITAGTSATTFSPSKLINREQVATMLGRAIKVMVPDGDFSTTGAATFSDQSNISSWAQESVQLMSKLGIMAGTNGKFMPKATTAAETAAGYGNTTREQAIAMSVRTFEKYQ